MSRNAFPKIERELNETEGLREHAKMEGACQHEFGFLYKEYDADGCGYNMWHCDFCDFEELEMM